MNKGRVIYFLIIFAGTALTIAVPKIVMIGFFLGIFPGLFLAACPTLLIYSPLWLGTRAVLQWLLQTVGYIRIGRWSRFALRVVTTLAVLSVGVAVPVALNRPMENISAALRAGDREPTRPIALPDSVALVLPEKYFRWRDSNFCETICQRLLYNGATRRVLVERRPEFRSDRSPTNGWRAFRVERRDGCEGPQLYERNDVVFPGDDKDDGPTAEDLQRDHADAPNYGDAAIDRVRARIATGECLIEEPAGSIKPGLTLVFRRVAHGQSRYGGPWDLFRRQVDAHRLELLDPGGQVLFQRTEVVSQVLTVPLTVEVKVGILFVGSVGLARVDQTDSRLSFKAGAVLPIWLGQAMRKPAWPILSL